MIILVDYIGELVYWMHRKGILFDYMKTTFSWHDFMNTGFFGSGPGGGRIAGRIEIGKAGSWEGQQCPKGQLGVELGVS